MKAKLITLLLGLTGWLAAADSGLAQVGNNLLDQLNQQIELTDQVIQQAREAIAGSNSAKAQFALEAAIRLQDLAKENRTALRYREAYRLTREAREKAKYAIANGPYAQQGQDVVERRLERVSELMLQVKDGLSGVEAPVLNSLVQAADENLRRAWEFYHNGNYRPALTLANQVENSLQQIIRSAFALERTQAGIQRSLESTADLLEQYRTITADCPSEEARLLMEQAERQLELAQETADADRWLASAQALKQARHLATRAVQLCGGAEFLSTRLDQLTERVERLADETPPGAGQVNELIAQTRNQLQLARGFLRDGDTQAAAAALRAAELSLNQAVRLKDQGRP